MGVACGWWETRRPGKWESCRPYILVMPPPTAQMFSFLLTVMPEQGVDGPELKFNGDEILVAPGSHKAFLWKL